MDRERVAKRLRESGYLDVDALSSDEDWVEVADLVIEATGAGRLEAIVRAVADCEPMAYCPGDEMYGDWYECGFCGVQADSVSRYGEWKPVEHRPDCEWRRAREWADADGGDDGGP